MFTSIVRGLIAFFAPSVYFDKNVKKRFYGIFPDGLYSKGLENRSRKKLTHHEFQAFVRKNSDKEKLEDSEIDILFAFSLKKIYVRMFYFLASTVVLGLISLIVGWISGIDRGSAIAVSSIVVAAIGAMSSLALQIGKHIHNENTKND